MSRHMQRPSKTHLVCTNCKKGNCSACVDVLRTLYTDDFICRCTRRGHSGEPNLKQVEDPFTGNIHGPCAVIHPDGKVIISHSFVTMPDGTKVCNSCGFSFQD